MVPRFGSEAPHPGEGHRDQRRTLRGAVRLTYFIDANVFVHATIASGSEGEAAAAVIGRLADGSWSGVTSSLVVDEVIWSVWKYTSRDAGLEAGEQVYRIPHLAVIGVNDRVPQHAIALMRKHPLKPRDAFHVATMMEAGVTAIVSTDPDFDKVKEIRRLDPSSVPKRK